MTKKIKYISIGTPICFDIAHDLPESEKTAEMVMNIYGNAKDGKGMINPVSLDVALDPKAKDSEYYEQESKIPEIGWKDVENFMKDGSFLLIAISGISGKNFQETSEVIKLAKKLSIPFHVIVCRMPSFLSFEAENESGYESKLLEITSDITFTNIYKDTLEQANPDAKSADVFAECGKKINVLIPEIVKKATKGA